MSSQNLLGSVLIAAALFVFFAFVLPAYDQIKATQTGIDERQVSLVELQNAMQRVKQLDSQLEGRVEEVEKLGGVIADEKRSDEVLSSVDAIANQNGMQILKFSMAETGRQEGFSVAGVDLILRGSYLSFRNFIEGLENNLRLFDVQNLSISAPDEGGFLNINIKFNLYYLTNNNG